MNRTISSAICAAVLLAGTVVTSAGADDLEEHQTYQGQIQFGAPSPETEAGADGAAAVRGARTPIDVSSVCRKIGDRKEIAMRDCLTMMSFLLLQLAAKGNVQIPLSQPDTAAEPRE